MKKISLLFVLFILCGRFAFSQTLYEFHYHFNLADGAKDEYKAFVYRNPDGTGIMRVVYFDPKTRARNIAEMSMQEHYGVNDNGTTDSTMLILMGSDEEKEQIVGTYPYQTDHFVFTLSADGYFEPASVVSFNDDSTDVVGTFDEARLLNQEDLTKDLVLEYFTEKDEFYINLFETTVRSLSAEEKQTRLNLILVANTEDKTIGKSSVIDRDATLKTFSEIAEFLEIQFNPVVISGKDFSKVNVENAINSLRPGKQDIVVFYYSGHGFNNLKENYVFPYLDLRDKSFQMWGGQYTMNIEAIYQKLKAKGARFNLVISDCCNNDPSQSSNMSSEGATTRTSSIGWNKDNCLALFMNPKPMSLLMTAATRGELSAGNPADGGIFTFNFRESLEKFLGPFFNDVSWSTLVAIAKKRTIEKADHTWCIGDDNVKKPCHQTPIFKIE
jgi:Caspase domain